MENKNTQHIQVPHNLGGTKEIKLNPTDYLIYGYMRKYMDGKTYQTFISLRTLAEKAGISIIPLVTVLRSCKLLGRLEY